MPGDASSVSGCKPAGYRVTKQGLIGAIIGAVRFFTSADQNPAFAMQVTGCCLFLFSENFFVKVDRCRVRSHSDKIVGEALTSACFETVRRVGWRPGKIIKKR